MNETDKIVKQLRATVAIKRKQVEAAERATWLTNCTFSYARDTTCAHGRIQVQVVTDTDQLVKALAFLYSEQANYEKAATELGIKYEGFKWQGYSIQEWASDFKTRVAKIKISSRRKELASLEERLEKLLSPELKTQLELEEITKLLEDQND